MVRYTGPKNRIARRFGVNIFGRARNPLLHKPNPPGVHGAKKKKKSDYGLQLEEQQKLKAAYGMLTGKQLIRYFREADASKESTPQAFIERLESRLDIVVYRMKFASTIFSAQQIVSHGHILVDGKKVDRRSFRVYPGMKISVKTSSRGMPLIKEAVVSGGKEVPQYLSVDTENFIGEMTSIPHMDQISFPLPINVPLICEFLAHTH